MLDSFLPLIYLFIFIRPFLPLIAFLYLQVSSFQSISLVFEKFEGKCQERNKEKNKI